MKTIETVETPTYRELNEWLGLTDEHLDYDAWADGVESASAVLTEASSATDWAHIDLRTYLGAEPEMPTVGLREDGAALFYSGKVNLVFGESSSGKSWLALLAVAQVLRDGGTAVYIDFEDGPRGIASRLSLLGVTPEEMDRLTYRNPSTLSPEGRDQLLGWVGRSSIVVIDATTEALSMVGLSSNSDVDVATFVTMLPRWAAHHGPAVVLIDHTPKDRTNRQGPQGSQHKRASVDGAAYFVEVGAPFARGHGGYSRLRVNKDRPGGVGPMGTVYGHLSTDGEGAFRIEEGAPVVAIEKEDVWLSQVLAVVRREPGISYRRLREESGLNTGQLDAAIAAGAGDGSIEERPGKRVGKNVQRCFYADEDDTDGY